MTTCPSLAPAVFARSDQPGSLVVRTEITPAGPRFLGQGFELRVFVNAADQRPEIQIPRITGAESTVVATTFQPLSVSEIGPFVSQRNRFVTRLRVIPRRTGVLDIPSFRASIGSEVGRSQPTRITILPVPPDGRPPEFLGGVGKFSVTASVSSGAVRVGQDLEFRITVSGPAAAGMTAQPALDDLLPLPIALSIQRLDDQFSPDPLSRTFRYRLRPTKPAEVVLPPIKIAAFDPLSRHYLSQVSHGVPLRVVATPAFDPATIENLAPTPSPRAPISRLAIVVALLTTITVAAAAYAGVRRVRSFRASRDYTTPPRTFALELTRELDALVDLYRPNRHQRATEIDPPRSMTRSPDELSRQITDGLIRYLELAIERPPGALTPTEARIAIATCTEAHALGDQAERLIQTCDSHRFRLEPPIAMVEPDARSMLEDARLLFRKLARQPSSPRVAKALKARARQQSLTDYRRAVSSDRDAAVLNSSLEAGSTRLARSRSKP